MILLLIPGLVPDLCKQESNPNEHAKDFEKEKVSHQISPDHWVVHMKVKKEHGKGFQD